MSEKDYLIPSPPVPWRKRFSTDRIISIAALVVAAGAGLFSGLQYRAVSRQAKAAEDQVNIARQARDDATTSAKNQADDVKRAREAAEKSADAAQKLSNGMERSASAAEKSASAGREALALNRRALILSNQPNVVALNSRLSQQLAAGTAPEVNTQIANLGKGAASKVLNRGWIFVSPHRIFPFLPVDSESAKIA